MARAAFERFSAGAQPEMQMLGICGRLQAGDFGALAALEQHLPDLLHTRMGYQFGSQLSGVRFNEHPAALHVLARIALQEQTFPSLEHTVVTNAMFSRRIEFAPYLIAIMESPSLSLRDSAVYGLCALVRSVAAQGTVVQWTNDMDAYCPRSSPMADRQQAQADLRFWKGWWTAHKDELAGKVPLPAVVAPSRFTNATEAGAVIRERPAPLPVRYRSVLHMVTPREAPNHAHGPDGAMLGQSQLKRPEMMRILTERLFSSESDREVFRE